jgi:hypothetical protein
MNSPFCPPSLFRASMTTAHGDDDLPDGMHARLWLNPSFGLPLCPFVVSPFNPDAEMTPIQDYLAFSADRSIRFPFDPAAEGPVTVIFNPPIAAGYRPWICWVKLDADHGDQLQLELLDYRGRLVGRRSQFPWAASGSNIAQIRISGAGTVRGVWTFNPSPGAHAPEEGDHPALELSLPYKNARWYTGLGESDAFDRARDGAPRRLPPQDDQGQPSLADPEGDELARMQVVADIIRPWLEDTFNQDDPPWSRRLRYDPDPGLKGKVDTLELAAIWAAAADPGVARYLGLLGMIPQHLPDPGFPTVFTVGSLLAVNPEDRDSWHLADMDAAESSLQGAMASYLRGRYGELPDLEQKASDMGLVTRAFMTVVAAAVPFDPPDVPGLGLGGSRWNSSGEEGEEWTQQLTIAGDPPTGPLAAVRTQPDGVRLHRQIDGTDPQRWGVLVAARDQFGAVSVNDLHVPSGSAEWTVWYSDEFGRWGKSSSVPGDEPGRPLPPAPDVELAFVPGPVAAGNGPASAGSIRIAVNVPDRFEPGMLPLEALDLTVDGTPDEKVPVSAVFSVPVPPTSPGGGTTVKVEATLTNETGTGPKADAEIKVNDPRPPPPLTAAAALTWTAHGDGAAELAIRWPPQPGAHAYRVYIADEQAISGAAVADASRAKRATDLFDLAAQAPRDAYRLVTDPAFIPAGGGPFVDYNLPLPSGLTNIQFVKVIPVTADWVEAPFYESGSVPVAVPLPDVPPAPSLRVTANADGTTTVEIHARGIDPGLLARLEPSPPQYRLRRATSAVGPDYAHEERSGDLQTGAAPGEWHVTVTIPGATPFVEASWYAEVRYPAEPGIDGHPDLVLANDRIRPIWSDPGEPMEMRWGPASLPVPSLYDPGPPAAPAATRRVQAGTTSVVVDPAPVAAPHAVGAFRLAVWRLVPGAEPTLVAPVDTAVIPATPFRLDDPVGAPRYRAALVDPLGRWSDAIEIQ